MDFFFSLLSSRVWLLLALGYWAAVTLLHEAFSNGVVVPFKIMLGARATEYAFVVLTLCGMGLLFWAVRRHAENSAPQLGESRAPRLVENSASRYDPRRLTLSKHDLWRWGLFFALTVLCSVWLMVTRIEMAHFPQYAILTTLLRLGGLSSASAYMAGQCGSIVDEGRQYLLHPRYTGYFDWNDLLINSVGLCLGLLLMRHCKRLDYAPAIAPAIAYVAAESALSIWVGRVSAALLALGGVALLAGLATGRVLAYLPQSPQQIPDPLPLVEGSRVLALFLRDPPAFWHVGPFGSYHVMGVGEGLLLVPLLSWLFFLCCREKKTITKVD